MTEFDRQVAEASGYADLGMWMDAQKTLDDLDAECGLELPVLLLRQRIYRGLGATHELSVVTMLINAAREVARESGQVLSEEG